MCGIKQTPPPCFRAEQYLGGGYTEKCKICAHAGAHDAHRSREEEYLTTTRFPLALTTNFTRASLLVALRKATTPPHPARIAD